MSLRWYANRLRSMSVPEIAFRIRERAAKAAARGRLDDWARYPPGGTETPVIPGLVAALYARADAASAGRIADAARILLAGNYATLGVTWPRRDPNRLFDPDIWRLDPVTGETWPSSETFSFDIPYRHEKRLGDIKYVWEFNRLQFLQTLAARVALGREFALGDDGPALAPERGAGDGGVGRAGSRATRHIAASPGIPASSWHCARSVCSSLLPSAENGCPLKRSCASAASCAPRAPG